MKEQEVVYVNKFSNPLLFLSVGAIVALLIVVSGLAFWQRERTMLQVQPLSPSPSQARPEPMPQPAPITFQPSSDEAATWRTYRNEAFGFEIGIPPGYRVTQLKSEKEPFFTVVNQDFHGLIIGTRQPWSRGFEGGDGISITSKQKVIHFGSVTALKRTILVNGELYEIFVNSFKGIKNPEWGEGAEILFTGVIVGGTKEEEKKSTEITNQILSTLRFLE